MAHANPRQPEALKPSRILLLSLLGAAYFAAGKLGLRLAFVHANATAVWPPTGIALTALLILGYRAWPVIFFGAFLVNFTTAGSFATSLGIALGNTCEAVVGAYLVNRFANGQRAFDRAQDIFKFTVLAALVSTAVSATVGVITLCLGGYASWVSARSIWLTWWLGDAGGNLIIAPLLILSRVNRVQWTRFRILEFFLFLLSLWLITQTVFGGHFSPHSSTYPLEVICMPLLIWVAFRFSQREAAATSFIISTMAVWGTLHGFGPFVKYSQNESLMLVQAYMGVVAVTTLVLASVVSERRRAEESLRKAHDELELRVKERTASLAEAVGDLLTEAAERKRSEEERDRIFSELQASHEQLKAAHLQLIQAAKLESVGQLAAGVAHEVKNPLAIILQGIDYLSKHMDKQDSKTSMVLRHTVGAVKRADGIVRGLLDFSSAKELSMSSENLNDVVEQALLLVKHEMDRSRLTVHKELASTIPKVNIDRNKIEQVFVNVLLNAMQAMQDEGTLTLRTFSRELTEPSQEFSVGMRAEDCFKVGETIVVAEVEDTGGGIPEGLIQKVFDPFFTTKEPGKGTGLGLAVVKKIVELHQGFIAISNHDRGGALVTIIFRTNKQY